MTCSACSSGLEKYLQRQPGIIAANVNLVLSIATVTYDGISCDAIERYISEAGFVSLGEFKEIDTKKQYKKDRNLLIILGIWVLFIMYIMMNHMVGLPDIPMINHNNPIILATVLLISAIAFIIYGFDIIKNGIKNLIHRIPNMDTLVMLSVLVSFGYSLFGYINIIMNNPSHMMNLYFESTCMIIYFIKLGRTLENVSKDKTKEALKKLVEITPQKASVKTSEGEKIVTIDEVNVGDILLCRTGMKIAVDGEVVSGKSYIDESFITGESKPILKATGAKVIAGAYCYDGYIEYRATKIGKDSTISNIVKLIVEATNSKTNIERLADRISGIFVPIIILISAITFIIWFILSSTLETALIHAITVLVVACPCALGLAVPLVSVVGTGICANHGLFIRDSIVLEEARNIDTIVFDKTGTVTYGKPNIFKVYNYGTYSDKELINIVANIEALSNHPISSAFKIDYTMRVENFKNIVGAGISGQIQDKTYYLGNIKILESLKIDKYNIEDYQYLQKEGCSIIFIVEENQLIGLIGVKDIIRHEAQAFISSMKEQGITLIMLTGDNEITAKNIASSLGIDTVIASVTPEKKQDYIRELHNKGKKVIMVGDGINDALALVQADIGISISDGTDIAIDSADVILMNNDINNIGKLIHISRKYNRIIKENLFWAFFYNIIMIPIAMGLFSKWGLTMSPMFGSLAMTFSSLTVVLNSLRLKKMV